MMTNTNWRELCAELTDFVARLTKHYYEPAELLTRARAALAEPVGEQPAPPTAEGEVGELAAWLRETAASLQEGSIQTPRLTRAADLLEDHPAPPVAGEVGELLQFLRDFGDELMNEHGGVAEHNLLTRAADLLSIAYATGPELWEPIAQPPCQHHPAPVPVAERLPGAEDCDGEGRCWWGWTTYEGGADRWHWQIDFHDVDYLGGYCCWLPASALPLPAGEVQP